MNTPICDFVRDYAKSNSLRLHMPGHKGCSLLGMESLDITEIEGADSLYEAGGIIRESEANASALFGAKTLYSTEGSSLCIRAMLYLACLHARKMGRKPLIAAGRNAHKTFLSAAALLDFDVMWLYPEAENSYLSCQITADGLEHMLSAMCGQSPADKDSRGNFPGNLPTAIYLTSPDYLGNLLDIRSIAQVCHKYGVLLLVDNAHGAYLKFLPQSLHPIDLGADLCCDSAHKTLPVLTGGAYLHISDCAAISPSKGEKGSDLLSSHAKQAMALFCSTSPSYLILQSLDRANQYLADGYREQLAEFIQKLDLLKERLTAHGYQLTQSEPLKLTINAKSYGYSGRQMADLLLTKNIVCEFSDPDFVVMMMTPEIGSEGLSLLENALLSLPKKVFVTEKPPTFYPPKQVMSIREAVLSPSRTIPAAESCGRILAVSSVGCPPAVPIVVSGERIDETALKCFAYYGIENCIVVDE